ncbi:hypothetical protein LEADMM271B_21170 [Leclercia adecarboxylata]
MICVYIEGLLKKLFLPHLVREVRLQMFIGIILYCLLSISSLCFLSVIWLIWGNILPGSYLM